MRTRNGSTTDSIVSASSPTETASVFNPTGPPSNRSRRTRSRRRGAPTRASRAGVPASALRVAVPTPPPVRTTCARPRAAWASTIRVTSRAGAAFDLANPLNRIRAELRPSDAGSVVVSGGQVTVTADRPAVLTVVYQRQLATGDYRDVANTRPHVSLPVAITVPVVPRR